MTETAQVTSQAAGQENEATGPERHAAADRAAESTKDDITPDPLRDALDDRLPGDSDEDEDGDR